MRPAYVSSRRIWRTRDAFGAVTSVHSLRGAVGYPSRVATRLYCSNKSYHPAITALITFPRDEYILACPTSLSPFLPFRLRPAAISHSIHARRALSHVIVLSSYLFTFSSSSCSLSYERRARNPLSFYLSRCPPPSSATRVMSYSPALS